MFQKQHVLRHHPHRYPPPAVIDTPAAVAIVISATCVAAALLLLVDLLLHLYVLHSQPAVNLQIMKYKRAEQHQTHLTAGDQVGFFFVFLLI